MVITFNSCSDVFGSEEEDNKSSSVRFYGEWGRISTSDFESVTQNIPSKDSYTFEDMLTYRQQFREKRQYDFESAPGGTRTELHDLLTQTGFTPNEADTFINSTIERGNMVQGFTYAYSDDYRLWFYFEVE